MQLVEDSRDIQTTKRRSSSTTALGLACAIPSMVAALFFVLWQQPKLVDANIAAAYQSFESGSLVGIGVWFLLWAAAVCVIILLPRWIAPHPTTLAGYFLLCIGTPALLSLGISSAMGSAMQKVVAVDDATVLIPEGLSILLSASLMVSLGGLVVLVGSRILHNSSGAN
ncbi:hypothetical protein ACSYDW_18720 [Paeniglutamicibacter sp. R2-26]|uniref:hypothetical protein n=1 Tax=Paeniglutamicibacter sp. R2-26 TaxID=3144417 RepID=UPI003EE796A8